MYREFNTNLSNELQYYQFVEKQNAVIIDNFNPMSHEALTSVNINGLIDFYGVREEYVYRIEDPRFSFVHVLDMSVEDFKSQLEQFLI